MAFGTAAEYLMRSGPRIPPNDETAATPAIYARSVFTKRQEALLLRRRAFGRFPFLTARTSLARFHITRVALTGQAMPFSRHILPLPANQIP